MADHYFSERPEVGHAEQSLRVTLRGRSFQFVTDRGVFSKERIDFGSQLLIETMEPAPEGRLLDLGCGYGPIGLTAAHLAPAAQVYLTDINERAVDLARRNAALNGLERVEVRQGDGLEPVAGLTFTTILCNPPFRAGKETVRRLLLAAYQALEPGGSLWLVIQRKQGAPSMKRWLQESFGNCTDRARRAGYHIFQVTKGVEGEATRS